VVATIVAAASLAVAPAVSADPAGPGRTPAHWDAENIDALLSFAEAADAEGLDPDNYSTADLTAAIAAGDASAVDRAGAALFEKLAHDLGGGAVPPEQRGRWFISAHAPEPETIAAAMDDALAIHRIHEQLEKFAPPQAQYAALRTALHATEDKSEKNLLQLNMERWRWVPRDLGADYVFVNIPSYEVTLLRNDAEIARHRVIVGARKTPTPQFAANITGVIVNPTWFVPPSIVAESVGALMKRDPQKAARLGYYVGADGGVRQKPGPGNALGRVKLVMANPYSVYLHDTPDRKAFDREKRALSHGCIRVDDALGFAGALLGADWSGETIADLVAKNLTVTVDLEKPLPVYIGYFTAVADAQGVVTQYPDIYGLDKRLGRVTRANPAAANTDAFGNCATAAPD
jgi:murein L,D-transpeptidase YcbB/YkuD